MVNISTAIKTCSTPTIPLPSLGNGLLNTSLNNGGILGSGILCSVQAKAK
jgi:hypothetical protein